MSKSKKAKGQMAEKVKRRRGRLARVLATPKEYIVTTRFFLTKRRAGDFWLSQSTGEGMQTSEAKITAMLEEFWKREF